MKCFKLACVVSKWMCVSCLPCSCSCKRFLGCLWEDCSLNLSRCVSKLSEMGPGSRFRRLIPERDQKIADNPEKASEGPPGINITRLYWGNEGELGSRLVGGGKAEGAWAAMNCHELPWAVKFHSGEAPDEVFSWCNSDAIGCFCPVQQVTRLVFCSGKLYYELVAEREQLLACTSQPLWKGGSTQSTVADAHTGFPSIQFYAHWFYDFAVVICGNLVL